MSGRRLRPLRRRITRARARKWLRRHADHMLARYVYGQGLDLLRLSDYVKIEITRHDTVSRCSSGSRASWRDASADDILADLRQFEDDLRQGVFAALLSAPKDMSERAPGDNPIGRAFRDAIERSGLFETGEGA